MICLLHCACAQGCKGKAQMENMGIDGNVIKKALTILRSMPPSHETKQRSCKKENELPTKCRRSKRGGDADATGSLIDDNIVSTTTEFTKNISRALKNQKQI